MGFITHNGHCLAQWGRAPPALSPDRLPPKNVGRTEIQILNTRMLCGSDPSLHLSGCASPLLVPELLRGPRHRGVARKGTKLPQVRQNPDKTAVDTGDPWGDRKSVV